jgi:phospholipid-translocating P-type ATPase (flippase)
LAFAAAKDAIEDYSRYKSDCEANNAVSRVLKNGVVTDTLAMNINPGDIIYVVKGEKFPVDAVIVSSSYDDGTCFIDTAELDGETNLKRRSAVMALSHHTSPEAVQRLQGAIHCEKPNENLNTYLGRIDVQDPNSSNTPEIKQYPLSMTNLMLRGAVLRNTDYCWCIVVYTGPNTKIIKNLRKAGLKSSRLERWLNWLVVGAFVYNAILLVGSSVLQFLHYRSVYDLEADRRASLGITSVSDRVDLWVVEWYLGAATDSLGKNFADYFVSFFSLYTYVIPISLFVSIELVRLGQGRFMMWDSKMTLLRKPAAGAPEDEKPQKVRMKANNTNLNEDLGAIDFIFSDKTGTLTQNEMRMAKWFIDGLILDEMKDPGSLGKKLEEYNQNVGGERGGMTHRTLELFVRALTLCHSVIPSVNERTLQMIYESQSPDESALLNGMATNQAKLKFRTKSHITIEMHGQTEVWELLQLLDFSSDRKRMSVIVRHPVDKSLHMFCKGADNIIMARLADARPTNPRFHELADIVQYRNHPNLLFKADMALQGFSEWGLRTLVVAHKSLTESEYNRFRTAYDEAEKSLVDREEKIAAACELVETELELLGCTAIEDRLQDEVPETIEFLLKADIKIWLLTGDKQETAINIGMSSRLLNSEMAVRILNAGDDAGAEEVEKSMDELIRIMHQEEEMEEMGVSSVGDEMRMVNNVGAGGKKGSYEDVMGPAGGSAMSEGGGVVTKQLPGGGGMAGDDIVSPGGSSSSSSPNGDSRRPSARPGRRRINALVVNGHTLAIIFANKGLDAKLLHIGLRCHSVICCRVTPLQKSLVVKMVRSGLKDKLTLAIGDGANDVSMIQAAHVGVGIQGREGNQAVRSADYAFGEFRFLRRLLTVHGRYSYNRMAEIIFYSFYKNLTFITVQWWFGFYSLWSGQIVYEEIFFTVYNVVFTSIPPICMALFEKDVNEDKIERYPELYRQAKNGLFWNWTYMLSVLMSAVWHSLGECKFL